MVAKLVLLMVVTMVDQTVSLKVVMLVYELLDSKLAVLMVVKMAVKWVGMKV